MHRAYGNRLSSVPSCSSWVYTESRRAGFTRRPSDTVGSVNGPFTGSCAPARSPPPPWGPVRCAVVWTCFGWCCVTVRGGLTAMPSDVLHSAFYLHRVWERILLVISRGKRVWYCIATCSLCYSPKDNNRPQMLRSAIVPGATGGSHSILQIVDTSQSGTVLYVLTTQDGLI